MRAVVRRSPALAHAAYLLTAGVLGCGPDAPMAPAAGADLFARATPASDVRWLSGCEAGAPGASLFTAQLADSSSGCAAPALPNGQWGAFKNTSARTGRTPLIGPQSDHLLWENRSVSVNGSNPVIALDGTVYVGSELGALHAFRPNGTVKWTYALPLPFQVTASPAVARNGTVYIAQENGDLHALNPDGTLRWTFDLEGYGGPSATPAVGPDQTIYVGTRYFYAVRPDGTLKWRYDGGSIASGPPAIGVDGIVYFPSGPDKLFALDRNGSLQWRYDGRRSYGMASAPAIAKDGTIYVNSGLGELQAIRPDGSLKWSYATEGVVTDVPSSPAVAADGTVYFGGGGEYRGKGGYLYAVTPTGELKWRFFAGCDQTAPSVGGDQTIYFGNNCGGTLFALRPDGSKKWWYSWPANYIRTAPAIGVGRRLYVGLLRYLGSGRLAAFGA